MPSLETLIRDSSWAAVLEPEQLDRVVRESFERASRSAVTPCVAASPPTIGSA